jgi:hypothetical protein
MDTSKTTDAAFKSPKLLNGDYMNQVWTCRYPLAEALDWVLDGISLYDALADEAESSINTREPGFRDLEVETLITIDGDDFLITFTEET